MWSIPSRVLEAKCLQLSEPSLLSSCWSSLSRIDELHWTLQISFWPVKSFHSHSFCIANSTSLTATFDLKKMPPWTRLSKFHTLYTCIHSDQKLYPKELQGNTNKYKIPVNFSRAKLAWYRFATIYYSKILTFHQSYPNLLQIISSFTQNFQHQKNYQKTAKAYLSAAHVACDIDHVCLVHTLQFPYSF